jgi:DHA1 family multidrug resistance protein-like MFS transporter
LTTKLDKKIFGTLFFSLLATITGVGIVVPLLPVYASQAGASGFYIGLIFGAFSLSRTMLLPYFGRLSDHKGRKPFIVAGLVCYALVSVAFIMFNSVSQLIFIRFLQGIASAMVMPVIQAYVGDITPQGREGFVMGLFNMSLFLGLSLGPVAGGVINDRFNMDTAFFCMGVLAVIGAGLSHFLLPATRNETAFRKSRPPLKWGAIIGDRVIIGLFSIRMVYTAGIGIIWGFVPVLADLEMGMNSSRIGILVMTGVLVSGLAQTPMGTWPTGSAAKPWRSSAAAWQPLPSCRMCGPTASATCWSPASSLAWGAASPCPQSWPLPSRKGTMPMPWDR